MKNYSKNSKETKKQKSGGKIQVEQLQAIRKEWFGGKCMFFDENEKQCNATFDLELAHAIETDLSIAKSNSRSSYERLIDVIKFPERFLLFCPEHHREYDGRDSIKSWVYSYYSGESHVEKMS